MAKKKTVKKVAKKRAAKKATVKKSPPRALPKRRHITLGLPNTSSVGHSKPPAADTTTAGGDVHHRGADITITFQLTPAECQAVLNVSGGHPGDADAIDTITRFLEEAVSDAVGEAEADTESESPRYQTGDDSVAGT
jgi:hypothetical protein